MTDGDKNNRRSNSITPVQDDPTVTIEDLDSNIKEEIWNYSASQRTRSATGRPTETMIDGDKNNRRSNSITPVQHDPTVTIEDLDSNIMEEMGNYSASQRTRSGKKPVIPAGYFEILRSIVAEIMGTEETKKWYNPMSCLKNLFRRIRRRFDSTYKTKATLLNRALKLCCLMGDDHLVESLLMFGTEPNGEPGKSGPLHTCAYWDREEIMRMLLEDPRTYPDVVNGKGQTPLHLAALKGNYEIVKMLLDTDNINVNATDDNGCTPLHFGGTPSLLDKVPTERYLKCISLLMNRPDLKLNMPCNEGLTSLSHVLSHKELIQAMLKHRNGYAFNLDTFFSGECGKNIRQAIFYTYPELISELPRPLQEKTDSTEITITLLAYLQRGDLFTFQSLLESLQYSFSINHWFDEPYYCTLLEIACQMKNRVEFITPLLNAGANPNTINQITKQSVLHLTIKQGNIEGLKELLKSKDINVNIKDANGCTPLHYLANIHPTNNTESKLIQETIHLIIDGSEPGDEPSLRLKADLNATNNEGETPLHIAARMEEKETIFILLRNGADLMKRSAHLEPPITLISPSLLESYLDECIEINEFSPAHKNFFLTFDYSFMQHPAEEKTEGKANKKLNHDPDMVILEFLSTTDHYKYLLRHPVISYFLEMKWRKVGYAYLLNFFIYLTFLILLTYTNYKHDAHDLLLVFLISNVFLEIFQLLKSLLTYIRHYEKLLLWITLFLSLGPFLIDDDHVLTPGMVSALFCGWTYFFFTMSGFSFVSIQFQMLKNVSASAFNFLLCFFPFFIISGLYFYIIFRDSDSKDNEFFPTSVGRSILKTVIMFAGEFEASNIPFRSKPTSYFIFIVFVFLAVTLSCLLNGIAVSDIQAIKKSAEVLSLCTRVNSINEIDKLFLSGSHHGSVLKGMLNKKLSVRIFPFRETGMAFNNEKYDSNIVNEAWMAFNNEKYDNKIVNKAICIANKRKKQLGIDENQSKLEEKIADLSTKINEIIKQLNILFASRDIFSGIRTSGSFANRR